jgi:cytochrome P450
MMLQDLYAGEAFIPVATLSMVGVALASFYFFRLDQKKNPWKLAPGWLPIVGHFHHIRSFERLAPLLQEWANYAGETGCFEIRLFSERVIVVSREDRAMEIYSQRPRNVYRTANLREAVNSTGGTGVFSAEGEQWKQERSLISAALNRLHMQDYVPALRETAIRLVQKWETEAQTRPNGVVATRQDLAHAPADALAKVLLGKDMDFLYHPESELATSVIKGFHGIWHRATSPIWYWRIPVVGQHLDGYGKYYIKSQAMLRDVVLDFERDREIAKKDPNYKSKTFLDKLYDAMEKEKSRLTYQRVVGNMLTVFAAGTSPNDPAICLRAFS